MKREEVEICPVCECESILVLDVEKDGYEAECPQCGAKMMLCDACTHSEDNPTQKCDWSEEHGCFRKPIRQKMEKDPTTISKAKRTKENTWVEGHFITDEKEQSKAYIGYLFGVEDDIVHDTEIVEVDGSTVCRCTGKKDCEEKYIYEKDIVSIVTYSHDRPENTYLGVVRYSSDYAAYCLDTGKKIIPLCMFGAEISGSFSTTISVVGNLIDNPDFKTCK